MFPALLQQLSNATGDHRLDDVLAGDPTADGARVNLKLAGEACLPSSPVLVAESAEFLGGHSASFVTNSSPIVMMRSKSHVCRLRDSSLKP